MLISDQTSSSSCLSPKKAEEDGGGAQTAFWRIPHDGQDSSSSMAQHATFCQRPPKLLLQVCNDLQKCRGGDDSFRCIIRDDGDGDDHHDDNDNNEQHDNSSLNKNKKNKREKVKSLVEECRRSRIPFKRKLKLQNINLGPEDIPINDLMGTPLGDSLSKLSLSCNHLSAIPPRLVSCLPALTSLDLSRCKLRELPTTWKLPKLKRLNLSHNLISEFPQEVSIVFN